MNRDQRALSWPLISTTPLDVSSSEKSCNRTNNNQSNGKNGKHAPTFQQLIAARRLICRRYYPEGSFGYVVLFVAFIVNILTHGLQLSAFFFLMPSGKRFKVDEVKCLGKCLLILKLIMTLEVEKYQSMCQVEHIELTKALGRYSLSEELSRVSVAVDRK